MMSEPNLPIQTLSRSISNQERFRLYIDESGDHVFQHLDRPAHRYLCLLGVWFKNPDYESLHRDFEHLKMELFEPHPDDPIVLHREDIVNQCRHDILREFGRTAEEPGPFAKRLLAAIGDKFHCHIDTGQVKGSGKHLCPGK